MRRHRIDLDFAGPPRRRPALGVALLLAGAMLAALCTARLAEALTTRAGYLADLASLASAAARARPSATPKPPQDSRSKALNMAGRQAAEALQSPWAELLDVIDRKPEGNVALLAVEPSAVKRTVNITAEARSEAAMLEHLAMLQGDPRLSGVALTMHQRQTQAPGAPWRYQIQGAW